MSLSETKTNKIDGNQSVIMVDMHVVRYTSMSLFLWLLSLLCCCVVAEIKNYENDPNMAKAMEYDLGFCDYNEADRVKAEKYYLEYLKDVNESFQKARVYAHIGALYATGFDIRKGEKADYDKARYYFRKVLELEPNRIDWATIQARTMLASMEESRESRIRARMDVYEWLSGIDAEKIRRLWLPLTPDNNSPTKLQLQMLRELPGSIKGTVGRNIIVGIKYLLRDKAQSYLLEISERFAGTELDKVARQHAAERGISLRKAPTIEVLEPEVEKVAEEEVSEEGAGPVWTYWLVGGAVGVAIAAGVVLAVLLRKKPRAK